MHEQYIPSRGIDHDSAYDCGLATIYQRYNVYRECQSHLIAWQYPFGVQILKTDGATAYPQVKWIYVDRDLYVVAAEVVGVSEEPQAAYTIAGLTSMLADLRWWIDQKRISAGLVRRWKQIDQCGSPPPMARPLKYRKRAPVKFIDVWGYD